GGRVGGLLAIEDAAEVVAAEAVGGGTATAVAHQAAGGNEVTALKDRGQGVVDAERSELAAATVEERIGDTQYESADPQLGKAGKDRLDFAFVAGVEDGQREAQGAGHRLHVSRVIGEDRVGRIDEERNIGRVGAKFA